MFNMESKTKLRIGAKLHGAVDFFFADRQGDAQAFNGQDGRKEMFKKIIKFTIFDYIVETGTFLCATAKYMAKKSALKVLTCENGYQFYQYSKLNALFSPVRVYNMKSTNFLKKIAHKLKDKKVFFYLDAHNPGDDPLIDEIKFIVANFREPVMMIDDFRVPNDTYDYDKDHTAGYLAKQLPEPRLFIGYPTMKASEETGRKRGCAILFTSQKDFESLLALEIIKP